MSGERFERGRSSKAPQQSEPRPRKRAATNPNHQACTSCRNRKVRCDAARPRCYYCTTHDKPCVYPPVWKRAKCSQSHVEDIETKLRQYESRYGLASLDAFSDGDACFVNNSGAPSTNSTGMSKTPQRTRQCTDDESGQFLEPQELQMTSEAEYGTCKPVAVQSQASQTFAETTKSSSQSKSPTTSTLFSPTYTTSKIDVSQIGHPKEVRTHQLQPAHAQVRDGQDNGKQSERLASLHVEGSDSDVDQDSDAENQIMDGMVEYVGSSPEDVQAEDSFDTSPSFNFALKIKASTLGHGMKPTTSRSNPAVSSKRIAHGQTTASNLGGDGSSLHSTTARPAQQDNLEALKSYFNQSYLQYVPQRLVAKALLDRYFSAVNTVWPFLIEEVTRQRYDQICSSDDPPSSIWMAQLNLVFALACQFYESESGAPMPDVYDAGKQYYLRGHGFVIAHSFDTCSITMLQNLLLVVQYQQGTMRSNECWLTTGHATRMALGLGVHTTPPANSGFTPLEIELRKRLWWGCFSLDRVCSMIYGRPIGIPHATIPSSHGSLPRAIDDKYIAEGKTQPDEIHSVNSFFVSSVKLYLVMDEIIERLHQVSAPFKSEPGYNLHDGKQDRHLSCSFDNTTQLTSILQLDGLLQNWHNSLPNHLKFAIGNSEESTSYPDEIRRQRVILKIRFLGMRILLHRQTILFLLQDRDKRQWPRNTSQKWPPLFSDHAAESCGSARNESCGNSSYSAFEDHLAHLSASMCLTSAQMQIETIDHARPLKLTGAWWWDFHFVFNSLCVLFGAMGLRREDHTAIVPALSEVCTLMQRGVRNIHDMVSRGGLKVARSERFLKRLMKAAMEQGQNVSSPQSRTQGLQSEDRNGGGQTDAPLLVESLPEVQPETLPVAHPEYFGNQPGTIDVFDWPWAADNMLPCNDSQGDLQFYHDDTPKIYDCAIENLLRSSFDTWAALEGTYQQPMNAENPW